RAVASLFTALSVAEGRLSAAGRHSADEKAVRRGNGDRSGEGVRRPREDCPEEPVSEVGGPPRRRAGGPSREAVLGLPRSGRPPYTHSHPCCTTVLVM